EVSAVTPPVIHPIDVQQVIRDAGDKHRIDPDFVRSVIKAESGYRAKAISPKGARGMMQLMPATATDLGVKDSFDPAQNIEGGTRYLRQLLERFDYDAVKALAAYNAGADRVAQYQGVPPYSETRNYVARIVRDYNRKKAADEKLAAKPLQPTKARSRKKAPLVADGTPTQH